MGTIRQGLTDGRPCTLADDHLRLDFDPTYGTLIRLEDIQRGWVIFDRSTAGLSFRLLVPLPERRNNRILGERHPVSVWHERSGQHLRCTWDGLTSEHGGDHAIRVEMDVALREGQAHFGLTISNQGDYPIENVWWPILADIQAPPGSSWLRAYAPDLSASAQVVSLRPTYPNLKGYWGVATPTQFLGFSPPTPFVLLQGEHQGVALSLAAPESHLVTWQTELRPGYRNTLGEQVPDGDMISQHPVALRCAAIHVPFILPGETRTLTPLTLTPYAGEWNHGATIYRTQRETWTPQSQSPAWAREPHAWLQVQCNSPEDDLRYRFTDLVEMGAACRKEGVKAIQLVGWNAGGQDQNNPSHEPDPRLGTAQDLRDAIAAVQAMGVKVILFAKFTWADRATPRFHHELHRFAIKDPYGDPYYHPGYQYQTPTQLLDINTKRFAPMCFLSEEYVQICEAEFHHLLDLGADGMLYDECQHHTPALLCFDTTHGHRLGAPIYAGDLPLIARFKRLCEAAGRPDFLFAGEACYDGEFAEYHLAYLRSWTAEHVPMTRVLHPHVPLMTAIAGFDDRNLLNQCLLYRYIISYEPYNFKGRLSDFPLTVAYGRQVDALRTELRAYFWDGEFRHEAGVRVTTAEGQPHHPYAVFQREGSEDMGVAIANYAATPMTLLVEQEVGSALARLRLIDAPNWRPFTGSIDLPPYSAAVVLPNDAQEGAGA